MILTYFNFFFMRNFIYIRLHFVCNQFSIHVMHNHSKKKNWFYMTNTNKNYFWIIGTTITEILILFAAWNLHKKFATKTKLNFGNHWSTRLHTIDFFLKLRQPLLLFFKFICKIYLYLKGNVRQTIKLTLQLKQLVGLKVNGLHLNLTTK